MEKSGDGRRTRNSVTSVAVAVLAAVIGLGGVAMAHDEIESSVPADRSQFDESISEVTINFGEAVDGVELVLISPDDLELPGEVVVVSATTARLEFEPLSDEGQYIVRYLAEEDGHLVAGAISFVYGSEAGSGAGLVTWIIFAILAAVVLAIGAFFSLRVRKSSPDPDEQPVA